MSRERTLLTESEAAQLKQAYLSAKHGPTRARLQAVRLYGLGYRLEQIREICPCSRSSLMGWYRAFRERGVDALRDCRVGGNRAKLTPEQRLQVRERLRRYTPRQLFGPEAATASGQFWTVPDLKKAVELWFGVTFDSPTSYCALFADCRFSFQRAQKVYRSQSKEQIMDFEERLEKNSSTSPRTPPTP
jgi:Transposase and inactivated derivatives